LAYAFDHGVPGSWVFLMRSPMNMLPYFSTEASMMSLSSFDSISYPLSDLIGDATYDLYLKYTVGTTGPYIHASMRSLKRDLLV